MNVFFFLVGGVAISVVLEVSSVAARSGASWLLTRSASSSSLFLVSAFRDSDSSPNDPSPDST